MGLDLAKARKLLQKLQNAPDQAQASASGERILNFLIEQLQKLRVLANGYPRNPIPGGVWTDGADFAALCDTLADEFSKRRLPKHEECATGLATAMACQVMAHYPEEIFPRVLRNSLCREALNQPDQALVGYEAIISDFNVLELDHLLDPAEALDATGRTILTALLQATTRLTTLRPERAVELEPFNATVRQRLDG